MTERDGFDGTGARTTLDRLIHEPARLLIVAELSAIDEADFVYLASRTGLTAGNISSHTSRLQAAGYLDIRKAFAGKRPRTTYALTERGRTAFEAYRSHVGRILENGSGERRAS